VSLDFALVGKHELERTLKNSSCAKPPIPGPVLWREAASYSSHLYS
jgi:hypothetical protein